MSFKLFLNTISILTLVSLNSACVTNADVSDKLNKWIGADADELVEQWGPPQRQYLNKNTTKVFHYSSSATNYMPMTSVGQTYYPTTNVNGVWTTTPIPASTSTSYLPYQEDCAISFLISPSNKVTRVKWRGSRELCHKNSMSSPRLGDMAQ